MTELRGRLALVTGGGRGIGAAIALALAEAGCDVAVLARSAGQVERVADGVRDRGRRGYPLVGDVTDQAALDAAAALGPVDVLVAAAGVIDPLGPTLELTAAQWSQSFEVNVTGVFRAVRTVVPGMVRRGWGRVVTISSGAASPPGMPSASAYSAGKAAVELLTVHLAGELGGSGVTANAVRPGVVDTSMQETMRAAPRDRVGDAFWTRFHGLHERGELLPPEVPAAFVARLAATELTGEVLDVRDEAAHARLAGA